MPLHWSTLTTFKTTARNARSPDVWLESGVVVIEYTAFLHPDRTDLWLTLSVNHTRAGLEYHTFRILDFTAPPDQPLIGRRAFRITRPGFYAIGVHTEAITRVTVRLLRA